ncbi:MAG: rod shape-determining protein [Planctomycetia bacterium]|jgi:rod shape-determining protein MreB
MLPRLRFWKTDLAVDLGTANTLIGTIDRGVVVDEPSVVAVGRSNGQILSGGSAVGYLARQMEGRTPESIRVVRPMRSGVITDYRQSESLLRHFFRKATARRGCGMALVTVPDEITPVELQAARNSLHRAGAQSVSLLNESMAAALGAGLPVSEPVASMICDIGAGTTEVAVFSLGGTVASRSIRVGGDALDAAVVDYLRRKQTLRIGLPEAERLRIEIGSAAPLPVERTQEVRGIDAVGTLPRTATITSEEIRCALLEPLEAVVEAIREVLDGCSTELAADLVDQGMALSGGVAQMPGLATYFHEQTGLAVRVIDDPRTVVARGALICLAHLDRWRPVLR